MPDPASVQASGPRRIRVIGPGRAGGALMAALGSVGWTVEPPLRRGDPVGDAAAGVDLLMITTGDGEIASVAAEVNPHPKCVVGHMAGSLGLGVLSSHQRSLALHPLVSLPDAEIGSQRLAAGAWFAVAGDPLASEIVAELGGRAIAVADGDRATYHAAAAIAANHLVVLLGQVERLAERIGVPLEAYLDLAQGGLDNVRELGPAAALTGPAARGDRSTLAAHIDALGAFGLDEVSMYQVLADAAERLADQRPDHP